MPEINHFADMRNMVYSPTPLKDVGDNMAKKFIIILNRHWGGHDLPCASFDKLEDAMNRAKELSKGTLDCYDIVDTDSLTLFNDFSKRINIATGTTTRIPQILPKVYYQEFYEWCLKNPHEGMIIKEDEIHFTEAAFLSEIYLEYEKSIATECNAE